MFEICDKEIILTPYSDSTVGAELLKKTPETRSIITHARILNQLLQRTDLRERKRSEKATRKQFH